MLTNRLPIAGFPHLFLAAQDDTHLRQRVLTALKAVGFTIETDRIIPPKGMTGRSTITAISEAFQAAGGVLVCW